MYESWRLYSTAIRTVERWKARTHIQGFLKEYSRNLLKGASSKSLEIQAAKFVQDPAGHTANEIGQSITGFEETSQLMDTELSKKKLAIWLSSLQPQSTNLRISNPRASVDEIFE